MKCVNIVTSAKEDVFYQETDQIYSVLSTPEPTWCPHSRACIGPCLYFYCGTKVIQHTGRVDQRTFCITSKVSCVALTFLLTVENVNCEDMKGCLSAFPETVQQLEY